MNKQDLNNAYLQQLSATTQQGLQQQAERQQADQQALQASPPVYLSSGLLGAAMNTLSTTGSTFTLGGLGNVTSVYPGQVINTTAPAWTTTQVNAIAVPDLAQEMKELKALIIGLRFQVSKLEGQLARMTSTGEGKDRAADEILKVMDCYTA